ncbi:hypothetical protein ABW19_dt0207772 [Dactylella cylindrospora]|nr:hypothetical protein ABW19_dt0207772 [Dactylella cylindrospora]
MSSEKGTSWSPAFPFLSLPFPFLSFPQVLRFSFPIVSPPSHALSQFVFACFRSVCWKIFFVLGIHGDSLFMRVHEDQTTFAHVFVLFPFPACRSCRLPCANCETLSIGPVY